MSCIFCIAVSGHGPLCKNVLKLRGNRKNNGKQRPCGTVNICFKKSLTTPFVRVTIILQKRKGYVNKCILKAKMHEQFSFCCNIIIQTSLLEVVKKLSCNILDYF